MPRPSKGARLWWDRERGEQCILDQGRKIRTGCFTRGASPSQEAEKALADHIAQKHHIGGERRAAKVSVAEVLLHYIRHKPCAPTTVPTKKYNAASLDRFFGDALITCINGAKCREYGEFRRGEGVKDGTIRRELAVLQGALSFYHKEYKLDQVPPISFPPKPLAREYWLTRSEFARLLWRLWRHKETRHIARFALIAVYTGTRPAAILALRWLPSPVAGHPDLERGVLYRRGAKEAKTSKGRPPARLHFRLLAHMRRWRRVDMESGITHVIHFRGVQVASIKKAWGGARSAVALPVECIPYALKHTAATWLMQRGVDPWEGAGMLGISVEMLTNVYGHHHPDHQKKAAGWE